MFRLPPSRLRLTKLLGYFSFDDDLGMRRNQQIVGLALHDFDGSAGKTVANVELGRITRIAALTTPSEPQGAAALARIRPAHERSGFRIDDNCMRATEAFGITTDDLVAPVS